MGITRQLSLTSFRKSNNCDVKGKKSVLLMCAKDGLFCLPHWLCLTQNSRLIWYHQELACILNQSCDTSPLRRMNSVHVCFSGLVAAVQVWIITTKKKSWKNLFSVCCCPLIVIHTIISLRSPAQRLPTHIGLRFWCWHHLIFRRSLKFLSQILDLVHLTGRASLSLIQNKQTRYCILSRPRHTDFFACL